MRPAGAFMGIALAALLLIQDAPASATDGQRRDPRLKTDGRLRPGHRESVWVKGFPGSGIVEISFFPTAICEDECAGRTFRAGRTDAKGGGRLRVHVPGTFIDHRHRSVFFRDGERIEVIATWESSLHDFDFAEAQPEPILVRDKRPSR